MSKIKRRAGKIPVAAFYADDESPYSEQFKIICSRQKIDLITSVPGKIRQEYLKGARVMSIDNVHWSVVGQQIAGDLLAQELIKLGYGKGKE